jgi:hypothetical protein
MAKEENIIKCKFAGDPEDEYCSQCDGLHPVDDKGNACPATDCGGYEPEEHKQEQSAPEVPSSPCETCGDSCEALAHNKECVKGITSVIRAESGVSAEINGRWYKFMFSEERIVPEGCDIEAEKQALWDSVNAEVDAQLDAVRN